MEQRELPADEDESSRVGESVRRMHSGQQRMHRGAHLVHVVHNAFKRAQKLLDGRLHRVHIRQRASRTTQTHVELRGRTDSSPDSHPPYPHTHPPTQTFNPPNIYTTRNHTHTKHTSSHSYKHTLSFVRAHNLAFSLLPTPTPPSPVWPLSLPSTHAIAQINSHSRSAIHVSDSDPPHLREQRARSSHHSRFQGNWRLAPLHLFSNQTNRHSCVSCSFSLLTAGTSSQHAG